MTALFWVAAVIAVVGAVGVVVSKTPVHSVLWLVVNFLALATLYLSLNAEFLALIQIIIYAGAIMVLFLFVIALLTVRKDAMERSEGRIEGQRQMGVAVSVAVAALLGVVIFRSGTPVGSGQLGDGFGTAAAFGKELLTTHVFPFELTAFVLMAAVVGVVVLVGRRQS